jgi:hypothetical protein
MRNTRKLLIVASAAVLAATVAGLWLVYRPHRSIERAAPARLGPDFLIPEAQLSRPLKIIAYGDMRFTDRGETVATNPKVRAWLVDKIAAERPDAVLLSGDVPWHGAEARDYEEFQSETKIWRELGLRIYPALGNHELNGSEPECIENWWRAFPKLRGLRWYSVQLGDSVYILNLDSNSSLLPRSAQSIWIEGQLAHLPSAIRFVFLNLHHPPVVDVQQDGDASHNGRPNEKALAQFLATAAGKSSARFIVAAGHIHNYERFYQSGIVYIVSGGGGAKPRPVVRSPEDLYQNQAFPNYNYVVFVDNGHGFAARMIRVADPGASSPSWQENDRFDIGTPNASLTAPAR